MESILSIIEKGVGNSKIMPITQYIHFSIDKGVLYITATDLNNFITYRKNELKNAEDGEAIIHADSVIKLTKRTTKEEMEFIKHDEHVEVKGNGNYKIGLLDDEFPEYNFDVKKENKTETVDVQKIKNVININESAISKEMIVPVLSGYNIGKNAITTDGIKMCINDKKLTEQNVLITQQMATLLNTLTDETVEMIKDGNKLYWETKNIQIYGSELEGIDDYPNITPLLELEHDGVAKINKQQVLDAMDRLMIFSDPISNNGINFNFKNDVLELTDINENSVEEIEYQSNKNDSEENVNVLVNIYYLKDLLNVFSKKEVEFHYGNDMPMKIVEGDVSNIISIMEENESNE